MKINIKDAIEEKSTQLSAHFYFLCKINKIVEQAKETIKSILPTYLRSIRLINT
jgi:hypothetical protein